MKRADTLTHLDRYKPNVAKNHPQKIGFQISKTASKSVNPFKRYDVTEKHTHIHSHTHNTHLLQTYNTPYFDLGITNTCLKDIL